MEKERKKLANQFIKIIDNKCTSCGLCKTVCTKLVNIGDDCIYCGQCIVNCPFKAITTYDESLKIFEYLNNPNYIVIASISPAVRVSLGDEFNMNYGEEVTGKIITSLRELNFDYIFDTSFGADITTIEETKELLERIEENNHLPLFSSCCPSWRKYLEIKHPELLNNLSTTKTPIQIQGYAIKNYFASIKRIDSKSIIHVAITPCVAKKYEAISDPNVDFVLTTHELGNILKHKKINFPELPNGSFDILLSESSGTGEMFGCSSGLTNAVLNNLTNKDHTIHEKVNEISYNDRVIKCLTIYGLTNFEKHIEEIYDYDFIEVMSCECGCVGGGGQPLNPIGKLSQIRHIRKETLKNIKKRKQKLISNNNEVKFFYEKMSKKDELHLK